MELRQNEIAVLRGLAQTYMTIATLPVQREKMNLWKALNRGDATRPMVIIDQLPWHELNIDGSLTCVVEHPMFRALELWMRKTIYKWKHFPVDMVVEPYLTIPYSITNSGYGLEVEENTRNTDTENDIVSHDYENQFQEETDISKIKDMVITKDEAESKLWLEQAKQVFAGIAPVAQAGGTSLRLQMWDSIAEYMGVTDVYYDLIDRPEFIHAILERMTTSLLHGIEQLNALGLANPHANTQHCSYIYTDTLLPDFGAGKMPHTSNCWGSAMAQLFTSASPATTEEFELPYISRIAAQYGMFYYGCCERLDDRLDVIERIPNVKKISCSPWSDRENFARTLRKDIILSNKPTPAYLSGDSMNYDIIAADLQKTCRLAKENGLGAELILKDLSTVRRQPQRLTEWAELAMKIVQA